MGRLADDGLNIRNGDQLPVLTKKSTSMKKYSVHTKTRGVLEFDTLPNKTYFLSGFQDENDKGKATLFCFDGGTCLRPIIETKTGKQVCIPENAGKEIRNGKLINA